MSFTTLVFAFFLLIVFTVYWFVLKQSYRYQNAWLLAAGYVFYGWWDWRFLGLIFTTTFVTWICALAKRNRKGWTAFSIVLNLAILCVFKYFNFFGDGLRKLIEVFGGAIDWFTIDILLPVGISFYTFQAIGYSVDTYKRKIEPTRNLLTFALYIAFFPQLVAGPIERAGQLLPQFERARKWDYSEGVFGMRQILWGLFKKCVVADGVAFWVSNGFNTHISGSTTYDYFQCFIAVLGFGLQIYGDFSGYSDIARGTARLFGVRLMNNFLYPFFSRNAIELWQRWHISLMEWFREYVYIPLGGSRTGIKAVNIMIVFLLSGLWHGADITFIYWGALCGVWYLIAMVGGAKKYRPGKDTCATRSDLPSMALTFVLFCLVFVCFRANSAECIVQMYNALIFPGLPLFGAIILGAWILKLIKIGYTTFMFVCLGCAIAAVAIRPVEVIRLLLGFAGFVFGAVMIASEWKNRDMTFALERMPRNKYVRALVYFGLYILVFSFSLDGESREFIYFQF